MIDSDQIEMFPTRMLLNRIEPDRNMRRFYLMTVQRDLFGGACLTKEWGRIGSSGQVRRELYPDEGQAVTALSVAARKKRVKGYRDYAEKKEKDL